MSALKEFGGCAWKLLQLGVVVGILGLGLMFIARPQQGGEEAGAAQVDGEVARKGAGTGMIAKVRKLFGHGMESKGADGEGGEGGEGVVEEEGALQQSQQDIGTGHVDLEKLLGLADDPSVHQEKGLLAEGTTRVEQMLFWQVINGKVHYRIVLQPYDREAHELMMKPGEGLFMSFLSAGQERVVPKSSAFRIDMKDLRVATRGGYAVGWFFDGQLPLDGVKREAVDHGKVGWVFSGRLHARLRQLHAPRKAAGRPAKQP